MGLQNKKLCNNYKLIDKWTTSMKIIDHVNISYYLTYHIFEKFPTFSHLVYLSHYRSIQETKYKDHGDMSSKSEYYLSCITIYQVSHQIFTTTKITLDNGIKL